AQSGRPQVLTPIWQEPPPDGPEPCYWEATIRPVATGVLSGAIRYFLLRLLDVSTAMRASAGSSHRLHQILAQAPAMIATVEGPEHRFSFINAGYDGLTQGRARLGQPLAECFPELLDQGFGSTLDYVYRTGNAVTEQGAPVQLARYEHGPLRTYYLDYSYQALRDERGVITGVLGFAVDVTPQVLARRQADKLQAQVRVADLRLRRQAEVLPIITFITDSTGHTTYMSPQWYQYTGLPTGTGWAEVDAQWPKILHPDDHERAQEEISASINRARLGRVEVRLRGTDGQYRWFLTEAVPEFDAEDRLLRRDGYMLDIHELRETRRKLETKDQLFKQILAQAPANIAVVQGADHYYSFFNPGYQALLGPHAQLGAPVAERSPSVNHQGFLPLLDEVYHSGESFTGHEVPVHLPYLPAAEADRYLDLSLLPMRDDSDAVSGMLVFAIDVTERVRSRSQAAKLALEVGRREVELQAITSSVPMFIAHFDPAGALTYLNPYFYEYTGHDPTEPIGDAWLSVPPDERAAVQARAATAIAAGQPWQATFRCRRRDGELRWVQTQAQPYLGPDGAVAGFSSATTEVHELQKRTEELSQSRENFAALADNIAQLVWMADAQGHIFWYNERWYDYTGLTAEQMRVGGWQQVHDATLVEEVNARYLASIRSGQAWEDTFPLRGRDGEYRWFLSRARPIRDEATGAVLRWFGTNTDVTELRQLQQQLADSEEEQRIQAESIPQQVWTARPDGSVDYYNHRTAAYLGAPMKANGPEHWLSFVHPDDRATMQERWRAAIATQRYYEAEFRLRRYDGEYRWFLGQAQARRSAGGQLLQWYGTNTDVHQLRGLQEQVLSSQARFKQLLETQPQLAWTAMPDGRVNYYNQRWYSYTGLSFEELRDWGWEKTVHPDDLPASLRRWQQCLATEEPFETEMRLQGHDGDYRWFLCRAEILRDAHGAPSSWVGVNTDVHDFRRIRQELEENNARLRRTNEDLDSFVYTASHDLKQPIHNMAGIFEELTRTAYFRDPEAVKLVDFFERALARIFATIDDLSAIVQVQRLDREVPAEPLDLAALATEVLASLHDQIDQASAQVELDFVTYPVVEFVRPNLQSIFFNLLSNSLRYADPARPPRIRFSSTPDLTTGRPILTVQDNGLGIDLARYGPELFQLFRRFHAHVDGTGVGLYLVNRIVQNHGGRIEVSSTVGEGTTFRIFL
ncbi:MAG: PAS domain-containing protein, partial [Bacteroidota bacterium]|nr:PAS domain-containing protein [Bacteroidota bacterium]